MKGLHKRGKRLGIEPKNTTIHYYWDNEKQSIGQQAYVHDLEDMLVYDICKVLEREVRINQCYCGRYFIAGRKSEKYCSEHREEGAKNARRKSLQNSRCRKLYTQIRDRLYRTDMREKVGPFDSLDRFLSEYYPLKSRYENREISEPEFFDLLSELDSKYRKRTKK